MASDSVDQFIDGLPLRDDARTLEGECIPPPNGRNGTQRPKGTARRRLTRAQRYAMLGAGAVAMFCCGGVVTNGSPGDQQSNQAPQIITVYVTAEPEQKSSTEQSKQPANPPATQPVSCAHAIEQAKALLKKASVVGSATDKALDLISAGNIAVQKHDVNGMNKATQGLRDLDFSIQHENAAVMLPYQQIMDGLATCQAD